MTEFDSGGLSPQPMPQTGLHPVDVVCGWLHVTRNEFESRLQRLGLNVGPGDMIDMAELLAAIRRDGFAFPEEEAESDA